MNETERALKVAIFSDIHGNCVAFDAILSDLKAHPVDSMVCLGDAIQGGAQPAQTVSRLRELHCPVVMGNADAWLLDPMSSSQETATEEQHSVREWSLSRLTDAHREFIKSFKPTIEIPLDNNRVLCFHGSPTSYDDKIFPNTPEDEFQKLLGQFQKFVLCGGHTHMQQVRRIGDSFFFNPGSVGVTYSHTQPETAFRTDPWAEYAILSAENGRVGLEFRRVPFDVDLLVQTILSSGRPYANKAASLYRNRP